MMETRCNKSPVNEHDCVGNLWNNRQRYLKRLPGGAVMKKRLRNPAIHHPQIITTTTLVVITSFPGSRALHVSLLKMSPY